MPDNAPAGLLLDLLPLIPLSMWNKQCPHPNNVATHVLPPLNFWSRYLLKRRYTTLTTTRLSCRGYTMAISRMDNPRQFLIKGFNSTRMVILGIRTTKTPTTVSERMTHQEGPKSLHRVMQARAAHPMATGQGMMEMEVALTHHITLRVMITPITLPLMRKRTLIVPHLTADKATRHDILPDNPRLDIPLFCNLIPIKGKDLYDPQNT